MHKGHESRSQEGEDVRGNRDLVFPSRLQEEGDSNDARLPGTTPDWEPRIGSTNEAEKGGWNECFAIA